MHRQKLCFKAEKAYRLGCQSIDIEGQTACYRKANCMLLHQNRPTVVQKGAKNYPKRA